MKIKKDILILGALVMVVTVSMVYLVKINLSKNQPVAYAQEAMRQIKVNVKEAYNFSPNEWLTGNNHMGSAEGGLSIFAEGTPPGTKLEIIDNNIWLTGLPLKSGTYATSFQVKDKNFSINKNINIIIEPLPYTSLQQVIDERIGWLKDGIRPQTIQVTDIFGFFTIYALLNLSIE